MEKVSDVKVAKNDRALAIAKYIVGSIVATLTIALLWWGMCYVTPLASKSYLFAPIFGKSIKIASMLRAFVLWNPYTNIGCSIGQNLFEMSIGKPSPVGWDMWVHASLGFAAFGWAKSWGRSVKKDLIVLTVFGVAGSFVSMWTNAASGLAFYGIASGAFWQVFFDGLLFKTVTRTGTILLGYPMARAVVGLLEKRKSDGKDSST